MRTLALSSSEDRINELEDSNGKKEKSIGEKDCSAPGLGFFQCWSLSAISDMPGWFGCMLWKDGTTSYGSLQPCETDSRAFALSTLEWHPSQLRYTPLKIMGCALGTGLAWDMASAPPEYFPATHVPKQCLPVLSRRLFDPAG